jgi:hypothetical protein
VGLSGRKNRLQYQCSRNDSLLCNEYFSAMVIVTTRYFSVFVTFVVTRYYSFTLQPPRSTRSSSFVTLLRPPISSSLKLTGRSFSYIAPSLWNNLPPSMRQPSRRSSSETHSQPNSTNPQPLALSRSLFHSTLKTLLFSRSHPCHPPTYLHKPDRKAHPPE